MQELTLAIPIVKKLIWATSASGYQLVSDNHGCLVVVAPDGIHWQTNYSGGYGESASKVEFKDLTPDGVKFTRIEWPQYIPQPGDLARDTHGDIWFVYVDDSGVLYGISTEHPPQASGHLLEDVDCFWGPLSLEHRPA